MRDVWVVDDDKEMSRAVGMMLELLDCKVTVFNSIRSAARTLVAGHTPDLILLDVNMPEISGLDMIEFLRRRPQSQDLPIVMLSSEATESTIDKALELGADSYITKPVSMEELDKAMATAFYKHLNL
jgi:two-component system, OmpR family, alkaline phosphatase synthesis response regulator PhoP